MILHFYIGWVVAFASRKKKEREKKSGILFGHFYLWEKFSRMNQFFSLTKMVLP